MLLKYNIASEILDAISTDVKWILPKTIELTTDNLYQFKSVVITKGDPYLLAINSDPSYTLRYLVINSTNSFTLNINNSFEILTNLFVIDCGPNRIGFTNLTDITTVTITNPTGASGPSGNQFTNPNKIEVKYLLILEKI